MLPGHMHSYNFYACIALTQLGLKHVQLGRYMLDTDPEPDLSQGIYIPIPIFCNPNG